MGPLTLGLTKLMKVCQSLLAAPECILHQPLHLTESLLRGCLQPQEVGRPPANSCSKGKTKGFQIHPLSYNSVSLNL